MEISNEVHSLQEYLNYIKVFIGYDGGETDDSNSVFFRGERKWFNNTIMQPLVFRNGYETNEKAIFKHVTSVCADEFSANLTTCEILAKMQHYGIPTRLVDITKNPLVALYFACGETGVGESCEDGFVYIVEAPENAIKYFDSYHVCMLACLARIDNTAHRIIYDLFPSDQAISPEWELELNRMFQEDSRLRMFLHYIRGEKPDFDDFTDIMDLFRDVILIPRHNNARIIRQSGAFIVASLADVDWGKDDKSGKYYSLREGHSRIRIKGESKKAILNDLKLLNITKDSLFPELYTVAESVRATFMK